MSDRNSKAVVCAVLLAVASAVLVASSASADAPAPDRKTAQFEIKFLKGMIDHHSMAVMMAELCADRAVHEELLELCDNIIATQTAEIMMMQTWLEDWYNISYEPQMSQGMMRQVEKLAELDGADFEIAFMQEMIKHHTAAIKEASKCVDRAYHEELIELCENIIESQSAEIQQMQAWLCQWYGICKQKGRHHHGGRGH